MKGDKDADHDETSPAKKSKALPLWCEKIPAQSSDPDRKCEGLHEENLLAKELQRRQLEILKLLRIAYHFELNRLKRDERCCPDRANPAIKANTNTSMVCLFSSPIPAVAPIMSQSL